MVVWKQQRRLWSLQSLISMSCALICLIRCPSSCRENWQVSQHNALFIPFSHIFPCSPLLSVRAVICCFCHVYLSTPVFFYLMHFLPLHFATCSATCEDYRLLENMNKLTSLKYMEMKDISINISRNLQDLNNKCESVIHYLQENLVSLYLFCGSSSWYVCFLQMRAFSPTWTR